ncbi:hypothetical protein ACOMHN_032458 [Nucella lapillus]
MQTQVLQTLGLPLRLATITGAFSGPTATFVLPLVGWWADQGSRPQRRKTMAAIFMWGLALTGMLCVLMGNVLHLSTFLQKDGNNGTLLLHNEANTTFLGKGPDAPFLGKDANTPFLDKHANTTPLRKDGNNASLHKDVNQSAQVHGDPYNLLSKDGVTLGYGSSASSGKLNGSGLGLADGVVNDSLIGSVVTDVQEDFSGIPLKAGLALLGYVMLDVGVDGSIACIRACVLSACGARTEHTSILLIGLVMASGGGLSMAAQGLVDFPSLLGLSDIEGGASRKKLLASKSPEDKSEVQTTDTESRSCHCERGFRVKVFLVTLSMFFSSSDICMFSMNGSDFVGKAIYGGHPAAPLGSKSLEDYEHGVRMASIGFFIYFLSFLVNSLGQSLMVRRLDDDEDDDDGDDEEDDDVDKEEEEEEEEEAEEDDNDDDDDDGDDDDNKNYDDDDEEEEEEEDDDDDDDDDDNDDDDDDDDYGYRVEFTLVHVLMAVMMAVVSLTERLEMFYLLSMVAGAHRACIFTVSFAVINDLVQKRASETEGKSYVGFAFSIVMASMPMSYCTMFTWIGHLEEATGVVAVPFWVACVTSFLSIASFLAIGKV